jgi:UDP:flavonoid glycosyltransferase YjiC (YdhE family)
MPKECIDSSLRKITPKRIVLATIGSFGDLHPCIALALELQRRNHDVTVASTAYYANKIQRLGLAFRPIRPDWNPTDRQLIRQCEDLRTGPEILYRKLILPWLKATYEDLLSAATGADFLLAGELVYAAPLVVEKLALRWASIILSPSSFFSSRDPSVLVTVPGLIHLQKLGPTVYKAGLNFCRLATLHWSNPVRSLRRELGLRRGCDPVFRDKFAQDLVLALFSAQLAKKQSDWPVQTLQPGFVFFDDPGAVDGAVDKLESFLAAGDPPIVFALGSTAAHNPGNFYEASVEAARRIRRRAVLIGATTRMSSSDVLSVPYAPYSQIFPRAVAIVHQAGSGTTAQALRAGRPSLMVPYGWDQPDNASRVERLGTGVALPRVFYNAGNAATCLERLLNDQRFASRAVEAKALLEDDALSPVCDAIERLLADGSGSNQARSERPLCYAKTI